MQIEVLEPKMHKFKLALREVKTIDEIIVLHSSFLDECLKECLLTDQPLFKTITSINLRTHYFSRVIIRFFMNVQTEEAIDRERSGIFNVNGELEEEREDMNTVQRR
jgi:gamma-tubulin complex component 2